MVVIIKADGKVIARCYGSDILGTTDEEEARAFIESYKKVFPKVVVNGVIQE